MADPLPVPAQLMAQLDKCKTVRKADEYYKARTKTPQVSGETKRVGGRMSAVQTNNISITTINCSILNILQEMIESKAKLPDLPVPGAEKK